MYTAIGDALGLPKPESLVRLPAVMGDEEAGKGFGQTYSFKYYPARIDYIFADKRMKVKSFKHFPEFENSDHFPIMARLSFVE